MSRHFFENWKYIDIFEISFPMSFFYIIGNLSSSSSKLTVNGLCGIGQDSSEFSLGSPTEHRSKFESYDHIEPQIIESELINSYVFTYAVHICMQL